MSDTEQREAAWMDRDFTAPDVRPAFNAGWDAAMAAKSEPVTIDREALAELLLTFLEPPKHGGSWTYNPEAAADAVIAHLAARQNHTENGVVVTDAGTVEYRRVTPNGRLILGATFDDMPELDKGWSAQCRTVYEWVEVPNEN